MNLKKWNDSPPKQQRIRISLLFKLNSKQFLWCKKDNLLAETEKEKILKWKNGKFEYRTRIFNPERNNRIDEHDDDDAHIEGENCVYFLLLISQWIYIKCLTDVVKLSKME